MPLKLRQQVWVIDQESGDAPRVFRGSVYEKLSSETFLIHIDGEVHTTEYPRWCIFSRQSVAENVFKQLFPS